MLAVSSNEQRRMENPRKRAREGQTRKSKSTERERGMRRQSPRNYHAEYLDKTGFLPFW